MVCVWYGICLEKKCNGDGILNLRVREKGTFIDKTKGEYKRLRGASISKIYCFSCLEEKVYSPKPILHKFLIQ